MCVYLLLSALQLRHGFPIYKIASSVLANNGDLPYLGAQVYNMIPFAVEIRALLDFTFSKTALDIFQFWQLWQFHYDFFAAKNSNRSYTEKILGAPAGPIEKCIFGVLLSTIIMVLLAGPLWFFSDIGGFVAPNPVQSANLELSFIIQKNLTDLNLEDERHEGKHKANDDKTKLNLDELYTTQDLSELEEETDDTKKIQQKKPYSLYTNQNPFFREWDQEYYEQTPFSNWTETRFFKADQMQDCVMSEYSDTQWLISQKDKVVLTDDIYDAMDLAKTDIMLQIGFRQKYTRK